MILLNSRVDYYGRNPHGGRDLIVGDIHGYFGKLAEALDAIGFDRARDRLFSVGDLVDRGPHSERAFEWLAEPWFIAVRGNHEEAAMHWAADEIDLGHYVNGFGGRWNVAAERAVREARAAAFADLPIAIQLETERGPVGIVHADCPISDWAEFKHLLAEPGLSGYAGGVFVPSRKQGLMLACTWSRDRHHGMVQGPVAGVRAVVVGHNEVPCITTFDNVIDIDTGGWNGREFTILDAVTLQPATAPSLLGHVRTH